MNEIDAETAARLAAIRSSFARIEIVRPAIIAEHEATGKHGGSIKCPACGTGNVFWSINGSRKHVHARCSTPGCVTWME